MSKNYIRFDAAKYVPVEERATTRDHKQKAQNVDFLGVSKVSVLDLSGQNGHYHQ